jgi:hypothetical protein
MFESSFRSERLTLIRRDYRPVSVQGTFQRQVKVIRKAIFSGVN